MRVNITSQGLSVETNTAYSSPSVPSDKDIILLSNKPANKEVNIQKNNIPYRYHPQLAKQKLSFQQTCETLLSMESQEISSEIKQKHYSKFSFTADRGNCTRCLYLVVSSPIGCFTWLGVVSFT